MSETNNSSIIYLSVSQTFIPCMAVVKDFNLFILVNSIYIDYWYCYVLLLFYSLVISDFFSKGRCKKVWQLKKYMIYFLALKWSEKSINPLFFPASMSEIKISLFNFFIWNKIFKIIPGTLWCAATSLTSQSHISSKIFSMKTERMLMLRWCFYTGEHNISLLNYENEYFWPELNQT